jgi:hypothetical protein
MLDMPANWMCIIGYIPTLPNNKPRHPVRFWPGFRSQYTPFIYLYLDMEKEHAIAIGCSRLINSESHASYHLDRI